jgi:hypothetical protein
MVKWYKGNDDNSLPSQKADLLTRYFKTCNQGDRVTTLLPATPQLDPLHYELPPISIDNYEQYLDDVLELAV